MDRESERPRGRSPRGAQHLRDISHLYLSGSRSARERQPRPRARFRLGVTASGDSLAKVDLCANLALQFARLGQRTLVIDLDPRLPNVGFRLGLAPLQYLLHLRSGAVPTLFRAALGIRLLEGVAADPSSEWSETIEREWRAADCVLVNLPEPPACLEPLLHRLLPDATSPPAASGAGNTVTRSAGSPRRALGRTTMARAGASSRMFGAWLQTAHRPGAARPEEEAPDRGLDAVLMVQQDDADLRVQEALRTWRRDVAPAPVHLVRCTAEAQSPADASRPEAWATWTQPSGLSAIRQPLSLLYPDHEAAQRLEGVAQSLLAGSGQRGGARVRTL